MNAQAARSLVSPALPVWRDPVAWAKTADIVVENFRPGAMERLGFGYEELHKDFPALIYCSLSGFGRTGPDKARRSPVPSGSCRTVRPAAGPIVE